MDGCDGIFNHPEEFVEQGRQLNEKNRNKAAGLYHFFTI